MSGHRKLREADEPIDVKARTGIEDSRTLDALRMLAALLIRRKRGLDSASELGVYEGGGNDP